MRDSEKPQGTTKRTVSPSVQREVPLYAQNMVWYCYDDLRMEAEEILFILEGLPADAEHLEPRQKLEAFSLPGRKQVHSSVFENRCWLNCRLRVAPKGDAVHMEFES